MDHPKKSKQKSLLRLKPVHTESHMGQAHQDLGLQGRSGWNILSRVRRSWQSCDICEHCVPVNAIIHYPLSLPAQTVRLLFSYVRTFSFSVCLRHLFCNFNVTLFYFQCKFPYIKTWMSQQFTSNGKLNGKPHKMTFFSFFYAFPQFSDLFEYSTYCCVLELA